jgi:hypothetical protein
MATTGDRLKSACPLHAYPVQECPHCDPLNQGEERDPRIKVAYESSPVHPDAPTKVWDGPAQLPAPAPAPEPLSVQDLDDFISNLQQRKVKRFAYTGNIKGAPVVLEVQFEQPRQRSAEEDLG